jgi:predicted aspartyl protease
MPIEIGQATSAHVTAPQPPALQSALALVDTGATHSCVEEQLAQNLNLPIINQQQVTGVAGPQTHNIYLAQLSISSLGLSYRGQLIGVQLGAPFQVIVGRDFLARTLTIYDGGTLTISV